MSEEIVIKKVIKGGQNRHRSNSWKIALADFMTALMIVFFILWVSASSDEHTAEGISAHFSGKSTINMDGEIHEIDRIREMFEDLREKMDDSIALTYDPSHDVIKAEMESDTFFDSGSPEISDLAKASLSSFIDVIIDTGFYLHVYGYADNRPVSSVATFGSNLELSTLRALSVSNYLINNGIAQDFITVHGEGELNPVSSNATLEGMAENRRVEIYISLTPTPNRAYNPFIDPDIDA